jgi:hypothetical protein
MRKLFLDDIRFPKDAINLVPTDFVKLYWEKDWDIVRNYDELAQYLTSSGVPDLISFDHDLADFQYDLTPDDYSNMSEEDMIMKFGSMEKTGLDCAKFLVEYCMNVGSLLPEYVVHSANPTGKKNIQAYLDNAKKHLNL